jgi:hypothetical protein
LKEKTKRNQKPWRRELETEIIFVKKIGPKNKLGEQNPKLQLHFGTVLISTFRTKTGLLIPYSASAPTDTYFA